MYVNYFFLKSSHKKQRQLSICAWTGYNFFQMLTLKKLYFLYVTYACRWLSTYASLLYLNAMNGRSYVRNWCFYEPVSLWTICNIHQTFRWVHNKNGSVLKLQSIIRNLCFVFSKNDLLTSIHVLFVENLQTYI